MKRTIAFVLPAMMAMTTGCTQTEPPLTDAERTEITVEVRALFDTMFAAVNEHDVDQIMRFLMNSVELHHAGGGMMFSGWQTLYEAVNDWHADPSNEAWSVNMDEVAINVLSRDVAVLTAQGTATNVDQDGNSVTTRYAITQVYVRQPEGWIITNSHESESQPTEVPISEGI